MCMRTLSAAPRVFLDAESRADSSASKRISLSIPFSRPICSITAISSRFISPSHHLSQAPARPGHLRVQTRLRDLRARHVNGPPALLERETIATDVSQPPPYLRAPREPAPDGFADRPPVLAIRPELPVQPRRGHFQVVPVADQPRNVEHVADLATHALTVRDPHAGGLVDEDPEHAP